MCAGQLVIWQSRRDDRWRVGNARAELRMRAADSLHRLIEVACDLLRLLALRYGWEMLKFVYQEKWT
jgi:hypothetical protein